MNLINKLLRPFGIKSVRLDATVVRAANYDTLERNQKQTLDRLWSDEAFKKTYEQNHQPLYESLLEIVRAEGLLKAAGSVIDVGCGPGYVLEMIASGGFTGKLSGCDFSDSAIQSAAQRCPGAQLFTHDVYQPLPAHHDLLFCMETIEHLLHPEKALANLLAASRVAVITVPEGRKDFFQGHINFWSPESWQVFCEKNAAGRSVSTRLINQDKNLLAIFRPAAA